MSDLIYARIDKLTNDVERLTESVQRLVDENRKARESAQLMTALQVYFQTLANAHGQYPKEAVSTMDKAIDGILMVNEMIAIKRKGQDNGRGTEQQYAE